MPPAPRPPAATAVVVTPTVGSRHLAGCIRSVQAQTCAGLEHVIVSDGPDVARHVGTVLEGVDTGAKPVHHVPLPYNTGTGGLNGYRIMTAFSYLVNADVVLFLDDDNWYDPGHVESCLATINELGVDWAFALRRICAADCRVMLDDDSDSLGGWRRAASYEGPRDHLHPEFQRFYSAHPFLIDTSCFAVRRETLMRHAPELLQRYWGDAFLTTALMRHAAGAATGERTVNYRLRDEKVQAVFEYFARSNAAHDLRFLGEKPWTRRQRVPALNEFSHP